MLNTVRRPVLLLLVQSSTATLPRQKNVSRLQSSDTSAVLTRILNLADDTKELLRQATQDMLSLRLAFNSLDNEPSPDSLQVSRSCRNTLADSNRLWRRIVSGCHFGNINPRVLQVACTAPLTSSVPCSTPSRCICTRVRRLVWLTAAIVSAYAAPRCLTSATSPSQPHSTLSLRQRPCCAVISN